MVGDLLYELWGLGVVLVVCGGLRDHVPLGELANGRDYLAAGLFKFGGGHIFGPACFGCVLWDFVSGMVRGNRARGKLPAQRHQGGIAPGRNAR